MNPTPHTQAPLQHLEHQITELAANINAATCRWLCLVAEFDRRQGWAGWGILSCAHWLNWKCGIALGAAREKVRVARALEDLPRISAAFSRGELSYSKVRAMTRVANAGNEDYWLMIAGHGTASDLETLVRQYRGVLCTEQGAHALGQQARRSLKWYYDDKGYLIVRGRLPAEQGEVLIKALQQAMAHVCAETQMVDVPAETPVPDEDPPSARRADGLELMAESFLAQGANSGGDRYQVLVHVDREVLAGGTANGRCAFEQGPGIPADTARRLSCDGSRVMVDQGGESLNIGRKGRAIPPAIRRALKLRDRGCRFPGCTARLLVDGHHVRHWAQGGEMALDNLVLLCRRHHRLVHEGGYQVHPVGDGGFRFARPDGTAIDPLPTGVAAGADICDQNRDAGLVIDAATGESKWLGETMDLDLAVFGAWQADHRRTGHAIETQ